MPRRPGWRSYFRTGPKLQAEANGSSVVLASSRIIGTIDKVTNRALVVKSAEGQTFTMTIDSEIEVTRDKKKCRKGSSRQIYTSSSMPGAIRSPT